jgi:protein O-GlcNAc transferase
MSQPSLESSVRYLQAGDLERAEETVRQLLRKEPHHARGWCLLGVIRQLRGRPDEALPLYQESARLNPQDPDVYNFAGSALIQLRQPGPALNCLEQALRLNPQHAEAYNNLGKVHLLNQSPQEALPCFREAVRLHPDNVEMLNNLALTLVGQRQFDEARPLLERLVSLAPNYAGGFVSLAALCFEQGNLNAALEAARKAVQLDPRLATAQDLLGTVLLKMGRTQEAVAPLQAALQAAPDYAPALEHLGLALNAANRSHEAESFLRKALQVNPANPHARSNLAVILAAQRRWQEVIALAAPALEHNPTADLLRCLGLAHHHLKQVPEAVAALEKAIAQRPTAETHTALGWAYLDSGRPSDGRASFEKALQLKPDSAEAWAGLGSACKDLAFQDEAISYYRRSLALNPKQAETHSLLVFTMHYSPSATPEEIFHEHREWARLHAVPPGPPAPHANNRDPQRRLRIGYVSADFCSNVAANYIGLVLKAHDRQRVEVFCYANVAQPDSVTQRLQGLADHWRNVFGVVDEQVEQMIRQDAIDVLVDLSGHIAGSRLTLLARKPAPVQATHFGYMNTTGLPAMDYRITDAYCDPPGQTERYHTEQLVRLPETLWCYRPDIELEVNPLPAATAGLVTLGMFNNFPKVTPQALAAWARILQRLPASQFLMVGNLDAKIQQRLRDTFAAQGIDPSRLTVLGRQGGADYYRLYHRVDLMLDPFPYTGLYTTADSLWMGVPVVTQEGPTYVTRQAASLLNLVGLRELIAKTTGEYVENAVRLAKDLPHLAEIRAGLRERLSRSPLMDAERFTRRLEEAYRGMWQKWCQASGRR